MPAQARMLWTCDTPGCEERRQGFCDEPTFCSLCLQDLAGVFDTTDTLRTEEELREPVAEPEPLFSFPKTLRGQTALDTETGR